MQVTAWMSEQNQRWSTVRCSMQNMAESFDVWRTRSQQLKLTRVSNDMTSSCHVLKMHSAFVWRHLKLRWAFEDTACFVRTVVDAPETRRCRCTCVQTAWRLVRLRQHYKKRQINWWLTGVLKNRIVIIDYCAECLLLKEPCCGGVAGANTFGACVVTTREPNITTYAKKDDVN